nr:transglutaminase-like domain-containing protein [Shimazuella soli]
MVAKFQVSSFAEEDKRDLLPSRGIEPDNPKIKQLAKKITRAANSDYERAKLIYRYVAKTMNYDVGKFEENSFAWDDGALKSLKLKRGVCQDYVFLTLSLLRSLDIPSRFIEGIANNQNHAWVEAKINGDWLVMDPTWGSGYIDPNKGFIKHYDKSFFDIPKKKLEKTHKRTGVVY